MNDIKELTQYIRKNFVYVDWGDFAGMNEDPTMEQLMTLKNYVENAIWAMRKEK